jgi:hypothetical protein
MGFMERIVLRGVVSVKRKSLDRPAAIARVAYRAGGPGESGSINLTHRHLSHPSLVRRMMLAGITIKSTEQKPGATETDGQTQDVWSPGFSRRGVQLCKEIENITHAQDYLPLAG